MQMSFHVEQIKLHIDNAIAGDSVVGNSFDKRITEAFEFTEQGKPSTTLDLLQQIKDGEWDQLDNRLRFRVLANIGNALFGMDDFSKAAEHWIDAYQYQQTPVAELHHARALQFQGKKDEAAMSAKRLIDQEPNNHSAFAVLAHVSDLGYKKTLTLIPEAVRSRAEVALALSYKALDEQSLDSAEQHVRDALADSPNWSVVKTNLAAVLLSQIKTEFKTDIRNL